MTRNIKGQPTYTLGERVRLFTPYAGFWGFENEGFSVGEISECLLNNRYSIALDGYHSRFVDFSTDEFETIEVFSVVDGNDFATTETLEDAKKLRRMIGAKTIIAHDRTISPYGKAKAA